MVAKRKNIPDFGESELWVVDNALKERYRGQPPTVEHADSEVRLYPDDRSLTEVPCLYWKVGKCNFIVFKTGRERYRCQFFYSINEQYGTGIHEYDNLAECVTMLLKMQADHEGKQNLEAAQ